MSAGSLTTSPPLNGSRSRKYARTIIVLGVGESEDGAIVGLGVAGLSVGEGVGEGVGVADGDSDAVGDGRLAVGLPETAGLGLAAGAPQAATRARIRSTATD